MAKKRTPALTIFIACEGSNTEPLYFQKLNEIMEEEDNYPFSITVYPDKELDKNPKTDAIGLVNVAIDFKEDFDELWVVFDKDGYTKHKEAFELAKDNNINVAFSSISFESWVLLHFERSNISFAKSANIIDDKFRNNDKYLDDYAKSGDYNLYPKIQDKTKKAFKNASWLRNKLNSNNPNYLIYEVNPYTDVDSLVKKLLLDDYVYEFREIGQSLIFNGVEIKVSNINNEYVVEIKNLTNGSLIWNEFGFYDIGNNKINLANSIILSGNSYENNLCQIAKSSKIFVDFKNLKLEINGALHSP
jgi:hypothetical protein